MDSFVVDILDALDDLGYENEFDETTLIQAAEEGPRSVNFCSMVSKLSSELRLFYGIEEAISPIKGPSDVENFLFEVSGFLSEYKCPYPSLVSGNLNERLKNKEDCLKLLLFLTSELQAAKMCFHKNPNMCNGQTKTADNLIFEQLKRICIALKMSRPPDNITLEKFFAGILSKLVETSKNAPPNCLSSPVIKSQLGPMHWEKLEAINQTLIREYSTRRAMLLKRVDVTISSFNWSDKAKANVNAITESYQDRRLKMNANSSITIAHLLAARDDLSQIYKTSSGSTRHSCKINKVLIGKVPDRGGRPNEVAPPPPEMPSWQKRDDGGNRRGGYHGSRGNHQQFRDQRGGDVFGRGGRGFDRGGGNRGGYGERPQSGRGSSRWGRGRGGQQGGGSFNQVFGHGGRGYGQGGFGSGRQVYSS